MTWKRILTEELLAASILGLEAIDNVLSSHEGQAEYQQLKSAFDALESAILQSHWIINDELYRFHLPALQRLRR